MDEFTKRLTAVRSGGNMSDLKRDRNRKMIRENFGNEENYKSNLDQRSDKMKDLETPLYQKAGRAVGKAAKSAKGFFDRLSQVRGK